MTRIEELNAMKGPQLIIEADKLGVKVRCDKDHKKLVEAKSAVVNRILKFEAMPKMADDEFTLEQLKEMDEAIDLMHQNDPESTETNINKNTQAESKNATEVNEDDEKPTPKRGALIEWNGKSQNICAWAKELGISANTLYGRLYKLGWAVDKAFTKGGKK